MWWRISWQIVLCVFYAAVAALLIFFTHCMLNDGPKFYKREDLAARRIEKEKKEEESKAAV